MYYSSLFCNIAGSVMYEYGMRLAQEVPGRKGLQRQAKCFLAAMNALRLVNENYAWIVKPVTTDNMVNILFIKINAGKTGNFGVHFSRENREFS